MLPEDGVFKAIEDELIVESLMKQGIVNPPLVAIGANTKSIPLRTCHSPLVPIRPFCESASVPGFN